MNSKKSNIFRILLSVVALLVILSVGVGVAFAWIEGGDRYSLYTENINLEGPALPSTANKTFTTGTITLNPKETNSINLDEIYDNITVADSIMFTPMSSDGTNFYLPQAYDESGTPTYFREATTNDRGTKYIDFDFKVKTTTQCYIAFGADPVITVKKGNSTSTTADTSALRFMITDENSGNKIFSTSDTPITNGKVSQGGDSIVETLTVNPISQYTNSAENKERRLYTYTSTETTTEFRMSIWLDCFGSAASLEALSGSTVEISLNLVVDQEKVNINFAPITLDSNGAVKNDADEGGSVSPTSGNFVIGDTVDLSTATVNENYDFLGWFKTNSDFNNTSNTVTTDAKLNAEVTGEITKYYAVFKEKPKYTITVGSLTVPSTSTGGTVTIGGQTGSLTDYEDKEVTLTATPAEGYRFAGWYSDSTCETSTSDYSNSTNEGKTVTVTIDKNKSYYAKFIKQVTLTVNVTGSGTVKIDGENETSVTVDYNTAVELSATPASGYNFDGFYNEDGVVLSSYTVNVTDDVIYEARFTKIPLLESNHYIRGDLPDCNWNSGLKMYWVDSNTSTGKVYRTFNLTAGETYSFKLFIDNSTWKTGNVSFTDAMLNIDFSTNEGNDTQITASKSQEYTFVYDVNSKKLSVYPSNGSYNVSSDVNAKSGKTILFYDYYRVGNTNYGYIKMYRNGVIDTGYNSFSDTGYGSDFRNLKYYVLSDANNNKLSNNQEITVSFGQDSSGSYTKYVQGGMYKGEQIVITGYGSGDNMNDETYNPLTIKSISYPENGTAGTSYTLSLTPENGCPKYISDKNYGGSNTNYKNYSFSYSVNGGSYTSATTGSTSGTALSKTWTPSSAGTYDITYKLTDGIDTVTYTQTITIN